ncbi:uncharacterized protein LOC126908800 [Daktulosphaira vitifoliae]|nr:uncharacterized protein LOC126908800 [Daktulosphaira vitifoliae]
MRKIFIHYYDKVLREKDLCKSDGNDDRKCIFIALISNTDSRVNGFIFDPICRKGYCVLSSYNDSDSSRANYIKSDFPLFYKDSEDGENQLLSWTEEKIETGILVQWE